MAKSSNRQFWRRVLVICGLSAVAFAAPLLDIYGRNPEVFVANQTSALEMLLFALIAALAVPALGLLILFLAQKTNDRAYEIAYSVMVGLLSFATGLVISRQLAGDENLLAVAAAVGFGAVVWYLVRRVEFLFVWASLALPVLIVMFVAASPSSRLIWGEPETTASTTVVENPASIVLLQLDELPLASLMTPSGDINEALFPSFARLSTEGTWYRNAFSDSIATTQSVPAILTGRLGEKGLSPSAVDHPENLFALLEDSHDMHVIEWVADLCMEDVCPDYAGRAPARFTSLVADLAVVYGHLTLPLSAREDLPSISNAWKGFLGQARAPSGTSVDISGVPVPPPPTRVEWADWVQRLANGFDNNMGPTLSYAHLESPHVPWVTNPSGTHYDRPEDYTEVEGVQGDGHWTLDPRPPLLAYQRYLYQVGFLDTMLGRMLDRLDETGQYDDTMVIVVADHGASFVPGEHRRWPKADNRDDLYRIPLLVKYPGQVKGEIVDEAAFGRDIVPTIVEALGIQTDWSFDGVSLLRVDGTDRPHEPIRWCCNAEGASTDLEVLFEQVERNHTWIPDQASWMGIAAGSGSVDILGAPVEDVLVVEEGDITWSLDRGADLAEADPESGILQTLLTGRIEFPSWVDSDELVVVMNDRVAGYGFVTRDSPDSGILRGLVAEDLIQDGRNSIDILIKGTGQSWISGTSGVLEVEYLTEDGRELDVRAEGSRRIQVDKVNETANGWKLEGWAADVTRKRVPDSVYLYAGSSLIASAEPTLENANVVRWFKSDDLLVSGFLFDVEADWLPPGVNQLTVIAEFDGLAVSDQVSLISREG